MRRLVNVVLVASAAVVATTCGSGEPQPSDDPCDPNYAFTPGIGPAGGTWQNTSAAGDAIEGFRVTVPPGKWAACWEVDVSWWGYGFDTPAYPAGFVPVPGPWTPASIEVAVFRRREPAYPDMRWYADDSTYMELSFPLHSIPADSRQLLAAFYYDEAASDWRIQIPDAVDADFLTIHTSSWGQWSWGWIDPTQVDFDKYVAPALASRVGTDAWSQIQAAADSVYQVLVHGTSWPPDCQGQDALEALFADMENAAATQLRAIQAGIQCGSCDVFTSVFWNEWREYVRLKQWGALVQFLTELVPEKVILGKLVGEAIVMAIDMAASQFGCDYECFWGAVPLSFYWYMGEYALSAVMVDFIQWYRTYYTMCSAATSRGLAPGDPPGTMGSTGVGRVRLCAESR